MKVEELSEHIPEIYAIQSARLQTEVAEYWATAFERSAWRSVTPWHQVPYNAVISSQTLAAHSGTVAAIALRAAECAHERHHVSLDTDSLVAASILHDVCKLLEMDPSPDDPLVGQKNRVGTLLTHGIVGGYLARELGMSAEIEHMILTHTPQSKMLPQVPEGVVLRHAYVLDADVLYGSSKLPLFLGRAE